MKRLHWLFPWVGTTCDGGGDLQERYREQQVDVCITSTWIPKVCRIIAFWAVFKCLGLLFCIFWGFR